MPGGDRTGPQGMGPMTGRAAGLCTGNPVPGYMNPGFGGGFGGGFGRGRGGRGGGGGRGWRNWFYATGLTGWQRTAQATPPQQPPVAVATPVQADATPQQQEVEIEMLRSQVEQLEATLGGLKSRLSELQ